MRTIEQEYTETRPKSRALYERAVQAMPSGVAHDGRAISPFPVYVERADGARKWDVDDHAYLDGWKTVRIKEVRQLTAVSTPPDTDSDAP